MPRIIRKYGKNQLKFTLKYKTKAFWRSDFSRENSSFYCQNSLYFRGFFIFLRISVHYLMISNNYHESDTLFSLSAFCFFDHCPAL